MATIDLAFMTLSASDESEDVYIPIQHEEIFLVMPKQDPLAQTLSRDDIDLNLVKDKKFVLIYQDSTLRRFTGPAVCRSRFPTRHAA